MSLAKKLKLEDDAPLHVVGKPAGVDDVQTTAEGRGIQGGREIAIDELWSALRLRPETE